jgi:hypothetical protein
MLLRSELCNPDEIEIFMSLADTDSSSAGKRHQQHAEMLLVPGGTFRTGSDKHYPKEAPVHRVTVDGFWMDRTARWSDEHGFAEFAALASFCLPRGRYWSCVRRKPFGLSVLYSSGNADRGGGLDRR